MFLAANEQHQDKLYLLDARPYANAVANMALGGGYESTRSSRYRNCELQFLGIENIHAMRQSLSKYRVLLENAADCSTSSYWEKLGHTGWLSHISLLIRCASQIAHSLEVEKVSVVLHCSDGWDRTSQLSALAMLMLDSEYRTLKGFQLLLEKVNNAHKKYLLLLFIFLIEGMALFWT